MKFSPADFFETELSRDNFLKPVLRNLLNATDDAGLDPTLFEHRRRFITFIRKKFSLFDESMASEQGGSVFDLVEEDLPTVSNFPPKSDTTSPTIYPQNYTT